MPFSIAETTNSIVDYICNSKLTHTIVTNVFIVALLLTCIVVSIFLGFFYENIKHEHWTKFVKYYIYSFLIMIVILLLHYQCQRIDIEKQYELQSGSQLVKQVEIASAIGGQMIKESTAGCGCSIGEKKEETAPKNETTVVPEKIEAPSVKTPIVPPIVEKNLNPGLIPKVISKPMTKSPFGK